MREGFDILLCEESRGKALFFSFSIGERFASGPAMGVQYGR
jgi:hypothetical protein